MKTKRVGTISMAIILISMGVIIFISQINQSSALNMAFKLWPLTLVLLGIEILWARYKSSDEGTVIRYDIFSIFIVFIVLSVNIGLYALVETGAMEVLKSRAFMQSYNYELTQEEFVIDDSIEKIVVEGFENSKLTVRTTDGNKILSTGSVNVNANSEENANKIYAKDIVSINKLDNIVYIKYKYKNDHYLTDLSISIPSNKKVEIKDGNELDLIMENINNNWVIDNINRVKIRLNKELNIAVSTIVRNEDNIGGNAKWTTSQIGPEENHNHKGELVYGDGTNILNILNAYEVIADEI